MKMREIVKHLEDGMKRTKNENNIQCYTMILMILKSDFDIDKKRTMIESIMWCYAMMEKNNCKNLCIKVLREL